MNYDLILDSDNSVTQAETLKPYFDDTQEQQIKVLPNFNKLNVFIGANNSGKSRFIRFLLSKSILIGVHKRVEYIDSLKSYNLHVENLNQSVHERISNLYAGYGQIINGVDRRAKIVGDLSNSLLNAIDLNKLHTVVSQLKENSGKLNSLISNGIPQNVFIKGFDIDAESIKVLSDKNKKYYIPTLRTAHSLFDCEKEVFKIERDIFLDTLNTNYELQDYEVEVFTGVHLHKEILNSRNSNRGVREKFEKFEKFISLNFFSGKSIDIVAEFNKDQSLSGQNHSEIISVHVEGEIKTRKLYELGDGIQAIIILMYKIFMAEPNSIVFIDEPELNLHPGMQRLFLEQIYSNKVLTDKNLTYVISTHSNHFLDLTIEKDDISIYAFSPKVSEERKDNEFVIKNVNRGDNSMLRDLGVNNSSVFLANSSIWVEGVSDRNYIKAFLKAYLKSSNLKNLKEDIDYAFFEYAGSNIEHYIFNDNVLEEEIEKVIKDINAMALSNKIFLLADSDNASGESAKAKRIKKLQDIDKPNFTFEVLQNAREIENLLPNSIWEKVLIEFCNKKTIKGIDTDIQSKIKAVLAKVDALNFSSDYIGKFLSEVNKKLRHDKKPVLNAIYDKSGKLGTLIPKRELSELVLKRVESNELTWQDFQKNPEIERLTLEIYKFITE